MIANHKVALENFKKSGTRDDFLLYKRECAKTRIGYKNIKKENFRKFCESVRKDSNPFYIWKKVKSFKNFSILMILPISTVKPSWTPSKIKSLLFFHGHHGCAQIPFPLNGFEPIVDLPFVEEKLNAVLNNLKLKSSPGLNNIDYKIISNFPTSARFLLLKIYNRIFSDHAFPRNGHNILCFLFRRTLKR